MIILLLINLTIIFQMKHLAFKFKSQSPEWFLQILSFVQQSKIQTNSKFTIINDIKQQIITLKKLEPAIVWHICLKSDLND